MTLTEPKKASGISVDEKVATVYNDMKLNKTAPYVIYKLSDDFKSIVIDVTGKPGGDPDETFQEFQETMLTASRNKQGRFAVYDVPTESTGAKGGSVGNLVFISWCDDNLCSLKQKMVLSSSKDAVKKKLVGIKKEMQANDPGDITMAALLELLKK